MQKKIFTRGFAPLANCIILFCTKTVQVEGFRDRNGKKRAILVRWPETFHLYFKEVRDFH
ncbi:hypothetical protein B9D94_29105 [Paenibacillus sp. Cedars]|nr:hypothetical protein B9D94_29105 [Paenibacillus sp. Cedars]